VRHTGQGRLGAVEGALDVDVDDQVDVLGLDLLERPGCAERAAGQGDEDVESAQVAHHGIHHRADGGAVAHVELVAASFDTVLLPQYLRSLLGALHVDDRDRSALGGEPLTDGPPDAACTAGDGGDP